MVIVILGGLVTSTLVNLFVMPSLYLRFGTRPQPETASLPLSTQPSLSSSAD
jgi:Cu/Ag efflux pump CusA